MIPYVRKSFYKHYCDGLKFLNDWNDDACEGMKSRLIKENISIGDKDFYTCVGIGERPYKYATDMTVKETYQAVEGLFHNLKIWAW